MGRPDAGRDRARALPVRGPHARGFGDAGRGRTPAAADRAGRRCRDTAAAAAAAAAPLRPPAPAIVGARPFNKRRAAACPWPRCKARFCRTATPEAARSQGCRIAS